MYQHHIKIALIPAITRWVGLLLIASLGCCIPYGDIKAIALGVQGSVYEIQEQNALVWIEGRLNTMEVNGEIEGQQQKLKNQASASIERPRPVKGLKRTKSARTFEQDLTITVPSNIKDAKGRVMLKAGSRVNPLAFAFTPKCLVLFDGEDREQLKWALAQYKSQDGFVKLVLVNGSPLSLMQQYGIPFYFDQSGRLSRYFRLEQIPAKIYQENEKLIISEVKM